MMNPFFIDTSKVKDPFPLADWYSQHKPEQPEYLLDSPDLTINVNHENIVKTPSFSVPRLNSYLKDNMAHEKDFGSEDMDYYFEHEDSQHYKREGAIGVWWLVGLFPFLLFYVEFY